MARTPNFAKPLYFSLVGLNGPWTKILGTQGFDDISQQKPELEVTGIEDEETVYTGGMPEGQQWSAKVYLDDSLPEQATLLEAFAPAATATVYFRDRDNRALVTNEIAFGVAPLTRAFGTGDAKGARMVTLGGRLSGPVLFRAKTAI